jgi:hypothetical protein
VNKTYAKIRACGERAITTVKTWKILAKLRRCPPRATAIVQASWFRTTSKRLATQDEMAQYSSRSNRW